MAIHRHETPYEALGRLIILSRGDWCGTLVPGDHSGHRERSSKCDWKSSRRELGGERQIATVDLR